MLYSKYHVNTSVRVLIENRPKFPTITICNTNPYATEYAFEWLNSANLTGYINGNSFQKYFTFLYLQRFAKNTRGSFLSAAEIEQFSNINELLYGCQFQGERCLSSEFVYMFHPFYINCYRFNSNGMKTVNVTGRLNGFIAQFYVDLPINLNVQKGIYLFIQNETHYPFNAQESPMQLSLGLGNVVSVSRYLTEQKPIPYSDCSVLEDNTYVGSALKNRSLFDAIVKSGYAYSQQTCVAYCQASLVIEKCGCVDLGSGYVYSPNTSFCMTPEQLTCSNNYLIYFIKSDYIATSCLDKCPLECNQQSFTISNTQYLYADNLFDPESEQHNTEFTNKYANQSNYTAHLSKNIVQVEMFYESFMYTNIVEEAKMTFDELVGMIGGHLHLFLGMSMISFAEILEFALVAVERTLFHRTHLRKSST